MDQLKAVADLLDRMRTPEQRSALAQQFGVSTAQLDQWLSRADLMRLSGVGIELAHLLEACGASSCSILQHSDALQLQRALAATNAARQLALHTPTLAQVEAWIAEAAVFAACAPQDAPPMRSLDELLESKL